MALMTAGLANQRPSSVSLSKGKHKQVESASSLGALISLLSRQRGSPLPQRQIKSPLPAQKHQLPGSLLLQKAPALFSPYLLFTRSPAGRGKGVETPAERTASHAPPRGCTGQEPLSPQNFGGSKRSPRGGEAILIRPRASSTHHPPFFLGPPVG